MRTAVRFAAFTFDAGRRELRRGESVVDLPPKAFALLGLLLQRRPEAVSKAEIRDRIWPHTAVSDGSLPRLVNAIRSALGDDAEDPRFLRTVHGFGYAFCGGGTPKAGPSRLAAARLVWGGRRIPLDEGQNLIGRDPGADACIDAATVSRRHARIVIGEEGSTIHDLGSKNGTWVGKERVGPARALAHGDEIRLGEVWVRFERPSRADPTRSAAGDQRRPLTR